MRIVYANVPEDYLALTRYQLRHPPRSFRWHRRLTLLALACIFLPAVWVSWGSEPAWQAWVMTAVAAVYALLQLRFFPGVMERLVRRQLAKTDRPEIAEYFREHDLELEEDQLIDHTSRGAFTVHLKFVGQVTTTPEHTFVLGPVHVYVIPRRPGHEAEYDHFVGALREEWDRARTAPRGK